MGPPSLQQKPIKRGTWSAVEDVRLREAVTKHGPRWALVAHEVETRNGDQCAKRWKEKLNPDLDHSPWTPEEENQLLELVATYGHNWKFLANSFYESRAPLAIKNRYSLLMRRIKRQNMEHARSDSSNSLSLHQGAVPSTTPSSRSLSPMSVGQVDLVGLLPRDETSSNYDQPKNDIIDLATVDIATLIAPPMDETRDFGQTNATTLLEATTPTAAPAVLQDLDRMWQQGSRLGMDTDELPWMDELVGPGSIPGSTNASADTRLERYSARGANWPSSAPSSTGMSSCTSKPLTIEYSVSCERRRLKSVVNHLLEAAMAEGSDRAADEDKVTLTMLLKS